MDVAAAADTGSITPSSMAISEGIYLSYAKLGALEMLGTLRVFIVTLSLLDNIQF